jgi:hypothetical protein
MLRILAAMAGMKNTFNRKMGKENNFLKYPRFFGHVAARVPQIQFDCTALVDVKRLHFSGFWLEFFLFISYQFASLFLWCRKILHRFWVVCWKILHIEHIALLTSF